METKALYTAVRGVLPDEKYSIYDIVDGINYVISEVYSALNGITSSLTSSSVALALTANATDLPADFESMISVGGRDNPKILIPNDATLNSCTYQIEGNSIKTEGSTVLIFYREAAPFYAFGTYTDSPSVSVIYPEVIPLPGSFTNIITDNIINQVTGKPVNVQAQALRLIANRDGQKRPRITRF